MKTICVIFGGESCEHDVSIITGVMCYNALSKTERKVVPIYVSKDGCWYSGKNLGDISFYKNFKEKSLDKVCLFSGDNKLYRLRKNKVKPIAEINSALNCMHGGEGESGGVFATFRQSKIACSSSGIFPSSLAMDKEFTKIALNGIGVKCLQSVKINRENFYLRRKFAIKLILKKIGLPAIIKPANLGSSIGVGVAKTINQLEKQIENGLKYDEKVIIEKYLEGFKEINCAVYKRKGKIVVSELEEPISKAEILNFDDKYKGEGDKIFPAKVGEEIEQKVKNITVDIYKKLNFSGVIRVDFLIYNEEIFVNEINSIPGSMAYYLFCKTTEDLSKMLENIINESVEEFKKDQQSLRKFDGGILNLNSIKTKK